MFLENCFGNPVVEDTFTPRIVASLSHRIGGKATASDIAHAVVLVFEDIERALTPVVGPGGVVALYQRSVHLAKATYEWIGDASIASAAVVDFSALRAVLAQQTSEAALAGGTEVLETFSRLLISLIGFALSEQLLVPVWTHPVAGLPVQDAP